jgi:hypothetical protein
MNMIKKGQIKDLNYFGLDEVKDLKSSIWNSSIILINNIDKSS